MTIGERIFELLEKKDFSQKDFSLATGIAASTISDWKKKGTNPASDKILIICEVLNVSPYYLLSGIERASEENKLDHYAIYKDSDEGIILEQYGNLKSEQKKRLQGYLDALSEK